MELVQSVIIFCLLSVQLMRADVVLQHRAISPTSIQIDGYKIIYSYFS
jgi:hypothetical protein